MLILVESARIAWLSIAGNKLRTVLTMLGVIIGVAAVIALVSIGQGAQASATQQIQTLGSNLVLVQPRGQHRISEQDLQALRRQVREITHLLPSVTAMQQSVRSATDSHTVDVEGTGADYPTVRDRGLLLGGWFTEQDVTNRARVAVLGPTAAAALFGAEVNPLGQSIRLKGQTYTVVGVAQSQGTSMLGQDQDDRIFVPYTQLARLMGLDRIPSLTIKTAPTANAAAVVQQINDYFAAKLRTADGVRVQSQDQLLETVSSVTQIFTLLLSAIASISLLVGGIGIMNIMLVSVSERTREIGIRKAIGAKQRDVLLQFLVEALILSVAGGVVGILLGATGASLLARLLGFPAVLAASSVALSFGFSMAVGVLFGFDPAYRASQLDPIEALRRE